MNTNENDEAARVVKDANEVFQVMKRQLIENKEATLSDTASVFISVIVTLGNCLDRPKEFYSLILNELMDICGKTEPELKDYIKKGEKLGKLHEKLDGKDSP